MILHFLFFVIWLWLCIGNYGKDRAYYMGIFNIIDCIFHGHQWVYGSTGIEYFRLCHCCGKIEGV